MKRWVHLYKKIQIASFRSIQEAAEKYDLDVKEIKGTGCAFKGNAKEANEQIMFYALNKISHGSTELDIRCCTVLI